MATWSGAPVDGHGSQWRAAGEKHGAGHLSEHQQRIHIETVETHTDMQSPRRRVSTVSDRADLVARRDEIAHGEIRQKRFERRHVSTWMFDGEERTIDDRSAEGDDPVVRRSHYSGPRRQIDATVTRPVLVGRGTVRGKDLSSPLDRPGPQRVRRLGFRLRGGGGTRSVADRRRQRDEGEEAEEACEASVHRPILLPEGRAAAMQSVLGAVVTEKASIHAAVQSESRSGILYD